MERYIYDLDEKARSVLAALVLAILGVFGIITAIALPTFDSVDLHSMQVDMS